MGAMRASLAMLLAESTTSPSDLTTTGSLFTPCRPPGGTRRAPPRPRLEAKHRTGRPPPRLRPPRPPNRQAAGPRGGGGGRGPAGRSGDTRQSRPPVLGRPPPAFLHLPPTDGRQPKARHAHGEGDILVPLVFHSALEKLDPPRSGPARPRGRANPSTHGCRGGRFGGRGADRRLEDLSELVQGLLEDVGRAHVHLGHLRAPASDPPTPPPARARAPARALSRSAAPPRPARRERRSRRGGGGRGAGWGARSHRKDERVLEGEGDAEVLLGHPQHPHVGAHHHHRVVRHAACPSTPAQAAILDRDARGLGGQCSALSYIVFGFGQSRPGRASRAGAGRRRRRRRTRHAGDRRLDVPLVPSQVDEGEHLPHGPAGRRAERAGGRAGGQ